MTEVVELGLQFRSLSGNIRPEGVTLHYGGGPVWGGQKPDHARCPSKVRAWHSYHLSKGWAGLAYSDVVCPHAAVFKGRHRGVRSAANGTNPGNFRSYAICVLWGEGEDFFTDEVKRAVLHCANALLGAPMRWVHSDWKPTSCPGDQGRAWRDAGWTVGTVPAEPVDSEDFMSDYIVRAPGKGIWLKTPTGLVPFTNIEDVAAYQERGFKDVPISVEFFDSLPKA